MTDFPLASWPVTTRLVGTVIETSFSELQRHCIDLVSFDTIGGRAQALWRLIADPHPGRAKLVDKHAAPRGKECLLQRYGHHAFVGQIAICALRVSRRPGLAAR